MFNGSSYVPQRWQRQMLATTICWARMRRLYLVQRLIAATMSLSSLIAMAISSFCSDSSVPHDP